MVAQNLEMVRTESYLASLLDDLFSHMRGEDTKIKTLAAFILSTLLRKPNLKGEKEYFDCQNSYLSPLYRVFHK